MAAARDKKQNVNDELAITEKLSDFMQKNRKGFFIGLIAVIVILAGFIIGFAVRDKVQSSALSKIDELERRYQEMKYTNPDEVSEESSVQEEISALLEELTEFGRKHSGFAAARAFYITGDLYGDQKMWAEAEKAWTEAARIAAKSYLAPISVYNAAVAAEEQGNIDSAIDLYTRALNYGGSFFGSARAQFSIGRLEESRNNRAAALEAYRNLVSKWPADPLWANLAQSRIIVLSN